MDSFWIISNDTMANILVNYSNSVYDTVPIDYNFILGSLGIT